MGERPATESPGNHGSHGSAIWLPAEGGTLTCGGWHELEDYYHPISHPWNQASYKWRFLLVTEMPSWASHSSLRLTARISNQVGHKASFGGLQPATEKAQRCRRPASQWPRRWAGLLLHSMLARGLGTRPSSSSLDAASFSLLQNKLLLRGLGEGYHSGHTLQLTVPYRGLGEGNHSGHTMQPDSAPKTSTRRPQLNMIRKCYGLAIHSWGFTCSKSLDSTEILSTISNHRNFHLLNTVGNISCEWENGWRELALPWVGFECEDGTVGAGGG